VDAAPSPLFSVSFPRRVKQNLSFVISPSQSTTIPSTTRIGAQSRRRRRRLRKGRWSCEEATKRDLKVRIISTLPSALLGWPADSPAKTALAAASASIGRRGSGFRRRILSSIPSVQVPDSSYRPGQQMT
jgi:hypothetical protein